MRRGRVADRHEWWVATDFGGGWQRDAPEVEGDPLGWVACCECGWRGVPYTRVRSVDEEDPAARRVHSLGRVEPFWVLNEMGREWRVHLKACGDAA